MTEGVVSIGPFGSMPRRANLPDARLASRRRIRNYRRGDGGAVQRQGSAEVDEAGSDRRLTSGDVPLGRRIRNQIGVHVEDLCQLIAIRGNRRGEMIWKVMHLLPGRSPAFTAPGGHFG
jgi:hypothetical protein